MKTRLIILFLFIITWGSAQVKNDSIYNFLSYKTEFNQYETEFQKKITHDSIFVQTLDSIKNIGYYTLKVDSLKKNIVYLNKGKLYKKIWVQNDSTFNHTEEWFAVKNLDSLIQVTNKKYAEKGYPFTQIKIQPIGYKNGEARVKLSIELFAARTIDGVKVEGYEKLSKGYIKHGLGLKKGKIYNETELKKISERIGYSNLVEEIRPPQTLFNTDSTTIYLYTKKIKSNLFDGILGFGNDANGDFRFNGNVKVELNNNFNGMEKIHLNWIATPDKSTTLDLNVRVPYLFRSAIGTQTKFNMYRRDSVFVSTKIDERLFYQITLNSSIGVNLSYENSNFVLDDQPELSLLYDDFNKSGIGISYEYLFPTLNRLLEGKMGMFLLGKSIRRTGQNYDINTQEYTETKTGQYEVGFSGFYLFKILPKHYLKTKLEGYGLFGNSDYYSQNELYRIGGFGSIRGFNEESIIASSYGITSLEYRFLPNEGFYFSVFGDYGFLENKSTGINENLLGLGSGISFLTKMGVFNLSYAVGKQSDSNFDFKNSKIHFGILAQF